MSTRKKRSSKKKIRPPAGQEPPPDPFGVLRVPYVHFGYTIGQVRKSLGLSQGDFGAMLEGFSQTNIARYETGDTEPPIEFWRKFTRLFGISVSWAITGEGQPYVVGLDNLVWRERGAKFLAAFRRVATVTQEMRLLPSIDAAVYFGLADRPHPGDELPDLCDEDWEGWDAATQAAQELDAAAERASPKRKGKRSG